MRTKQSDIFGKALGNTLEKGGTRGGAERGWETRRGRSPVEQPKGEGREAQEKPKAGGKQPLGADFLATPGAGAKFMDSLKGAPDGAIIRDEKGNVAYRKVGENTWNMMNPSSGKAIMLDAGDDTVFYEVRMATTSEAARSLPAWPSTGHGSPGHKGENWTMEIPEDKGKKVETYPAKYRPGGKGWGEVRQVTVPPRDDDERSWHLPLAKKPSPRSEKSAADVVGGMIEGFLAKEGTPSGAKRGWETRRGRAPVEGESKEPTTSMEDKTPEGFGPLGSGGEEVTPTVQRIKDETTDQAMEREVGYQIDNGRVKLSETHDGWQARVVGVSDEKPRVFHGYKKQSVINQVWTYLNPPYISR